MRTMIIQNVNERREEKINLVRTIYEEGSLDEKARAWGVLDTLRSLPQGCSFTENCGTKGILIAL